jgi:hypothetical protein
MPCIDYLNKRKLTPAPRARATDTVDNEITNRPDGRGSPFFTGYTGNPFR